MENVVALEIALADGRSRWAITWGRLLAAVDEAPLALAVLSAVPDADAVKARVCRTLSEAAHVEYFHEALLAFAWEAPARGRWSGLTRRRRAREQRSGRAFLWLRYGPTTSGAEWHATGPPDRR